MHEKEIFRWSDLNPICFLKRLLRELPAILAAGLAAAMLAGTFVQLTYHPQYVSTATVAVSAKSGGYSSVLVDLNLSSEIAETFTKLFESNMFSDVAKSKLGASILPGQLKARVITDTNLLLLTVTADSPEDAYTTLNLLLKNYDIVSEYVFQNIVLNELTYPTVPTAPSNSLELKSTMKKGFLFGCAGMVALICLLIILLDTVQTTAAVRKKLDLRLLATIHHEEKNKTLKSRLKKVNKGLLITMPIASFRFTEEVRRVGALVENAVRDSSRKVILVASTSENEGKSTVAANLALTLAQNEKKVLLIDADTHNAAQHKLFETEPQSDLAGMILGETPFQPDYLEKYGIWTLFSKQWRSSAAELFDSEGMTALLEQARAQMDYIIIDTPPLSLFTEVEILADLADLSILVVRQDVVSAGRVNDSADALRQCRAELLGCVFNDVYSSSLSSDHYGYGNGYGYGYGYGHYGSGHGAGYGYGYGGYKKAASGADRTEGTDGRA